MSDTSQVIGATLGGDALPTGRAIDHTDIDGVEIEFSVCDVANMLVFARAKDFGIKGNETSKALDADAALLAKIKQLRGKACQMLGMCKDWRTVDDYCPMMPMLALVSPAINSKCHIQSRLFLDGKCHTSMAGTGGTCTAACSRINGTIVNKLMTDSALDEDTLNIQHPVGCIPIVVKTKGERNGIPEFETLSFVRTSRRFLDGRLYIPDDVMDCFEKSRETNGSVKGTENGVSNPHENGHANWVKINGSASVHGSPLTTKECASFVASLEYDEIPSTAVEELRKFLLDYIGVAAGATNLAESTKPFLTAIKAIDGGGKFTVIANGQSWSAPYAAMLNGAFAHSLDFDDTHANATLHLGVSIFSAALAEAESHTDITAADFFTAVAVGYEITCRIGAAIGTTGYEKGFHNTGTCGLFGAIAVIASLRKLSAAVVENAFGVAISMASGSMQYLANGSWNKRLHPGISAHNAFICTALAEAGTLGAAEPLEGKYGLLHVYGNSDANGSPVVMGPFKEHWAFLTNAIKPYPACRMTHAQIEIAAEMRRINKSGVKHMTIWLSKECYPIVGVPQKNKTHPKNVVDAQFSVYYQTAVAWLYGSQLGWKAYDHLEDPEVDTLLDRISVKTDDSFALFQATIEVEYEDGKKDRQYLKAPSGEPENPITFDGVKSKFMSIVVDVYGEKRSAQICDAVAHLEKHSISGLAALIS